MEYETSGRSGGMFWLWVPLVFILFLGGAFSIAAYTQEPGLTGLESLAVGFGGLAALIVGLFAAAIGVIVGLIGAMIGLVAAGGAVAMTLFIVASPIIAIVLIVMMMRRNKSCPDPSMHG